MRQKNEAIISEILKAHRSPYELDSLKALLMGRMLAPDPVSFDELFEFVFPTEEDVDDPDEAAMPVSGADTERFLGALTAIWDELAAHQAADRPFAFTPLPAEPESTGAFLNSIEDRRAQMAAFLDGLEMGGYEVRPVPQSLARRPESPEKLIEGFDLAQILDLALFSLDENMEKIEQLFEREDRSSGGDRLQAELDDAIGQMWAAVRLGDEEFKSRYADFVESSKRGRLIRGAGLERAAMEPAMPLEFEGAKIGRNEPCPCGSGKKFKHCCLN